MQVEGIITVAQLKDALIVDKPAYARADSQLTVYRILPGQDIAERTTVQTGKTSVNEIEIIGGLDAGDRIILSDPATGRTIHVFTSTEATPWHRTY